MSETTEKSKEHVWMDSLNFSQLCSLMNKYGLDFPSNGVKAKIIHDKFYTDFPDTQAIKSTNEINIGDIFIYTGKPRGTGMYVPDLGEQWEIKSKEDIIGLSIQMIERGRGYEKLIK